jgi:hypothetical protein
MTPREQLIHRMEPNDFGGFVSLVDSHMPRM